MQFHTKNEQRRGWQTPRPFHIDELMARWPRYRRQLFYGHILHHVTAADSHFALVQVSRHGSVTELVSIVETVDLYPNMAFRKLLADSAQDNATTYLCSVIDIT